MAAHELRHADRVLNAPHAPAVPKESFVTRVGDLGCGVGYYK
jgi:hypothetical protein